jgi:hypothetical protein
MFNNSKLFVWCRCWNGLKRCVPSSCMVLSWSLCMCFSPHMFSAFFSYCFESMCFTYFSWCCSSEFDHPFELWIGFSSWAWSVMVVLELWTWSYATPFKLWSWSGIDPFDSIDYYSSWTSNLNYNYFWTWMLINYWSFLSFWALNLIGCPSSWTLNLNYCSSWTLILINYCFSWTLSLISCSFWVLNFNCCSF